MKEIFCIFEIVGRMTKVLETLSQMEICHDSNTNEGPKQTKAFQRSTNTNMSIVEWTSSSESVIFWQRQQSSQLLFAILESSIAQMALNVVIILLSSEYTACNNCNKTCRSYHSFDLHPFLHPLPGFVCAFRNIKAAKGRPQEEYWIQTDS